MLNSKMKFKVCDSYITVEKVSNNKIPVNDGTYFEYYKFKGSIKEFMVDTFNMFEIASLQI